MRFCQPDLHPQSWFPFVISSEISRSVLLHDVDSLTDHANDAGDLLSVRVATDPFCNWPLYRRSVPFDRMHRSRMARSIPL
jgi:hypothetical protein